jgi:pimeloyl-ACP methyl ester carboxylesterase
MTREQDAGAQADKRKLVVFLHGIRPVIQSRLRTFHQALVEDMPDAEILAPELRIKSLFCQVSAAEIAVGIIGLIDTAWQRHGGYDEIVLIGYSAGGALARKVFLGAWGQGGRRVPYEDSGGFDKLLAPKEWAPKITRIVMLASLVAGWQAAGRQRWQAWLALNASGLLGHVLSLKQLTFFEFRRGASFIVNTRLQWIDFVRTCPTRVVPVIQMLGSNDGIVAPDESFDFASAFYFIEVPNSDHLQLLDVNRSEFKGQALDQQRTRRELLRSALLGETPSNKPTSKLAPAPVIESALNIQILGDFMPPEPNPEVEHVVFVIHGIRDDGYWTKKMATRIKLLGEQHKQVWRSITPSYGYFTMLPFVFPWIRRQKVEWLMDVYAQATSRYPNATFHFVGHSNGTYLGAAAMRDYTGCFFNRVVFAGSVVHPSYEWSLQAKNSGVQAVMNYVATRDWIVALLPNAVRRFRRFDLGGAGHLGFVESGPRPEIKSMQYLIGGHSAGIREERWDEIAHFLTRTVHVSGAPVVSKEYLEQQGRTIRALGWLSPVLVIAAVLLGTVVFAELFFAAVDWPFPRWLSPVLAAGKCLRLFGDWQDVSHFFRLLGLILYTGFLGFITTRY